METDKPRTGMSKFSKPVRSFFVNEERYASYGKTNAW